MPHDVAKPVNRRDCSPSVSIGGKAFRGSLRTAFRRIAGTVARKRSGNPRGEAVSDTTARRIQTGLLDFYASLNRGSDDPGWSRTSRLRYQTSAIRIGRVLTDSSDGKSNDIDDIDDIDDVGAWEIIAAELARFVALREDSRTSIATVNRDFTAFGYLMASIKKREWTEFDPVQSREKRGMREGLPDINMPPDVGTRPLVERAPGTLTFFPLLPDATGGRVIETSSIQRSHMRDLDRPVGGNVSPVPCGTKGR